MTSEDSSALLLIIRRTPAPLPPIVVDRKKLARMLGAERGVRSGVPHIEDLVRARLEEKNRGARRASRVLIALGLVAGAALFAAIRMKLVQVDWSSLLALMTS